MATKYYVVWQGRQTGIFTDWASCKDQVERFPGAKYQSFASPQEAKVAFSGATGPTKKTSKTRAEGKSSASGKTYPAEEVAAMPIDTKIFTDGGCDPNPGKAGSGVAIYRNNIIDQLWYGLYDPNGTNNTAELNALNQALIMASDEIEKDRTVAIFCDSKYSIQCITQWAVGWQKRGWKKATGEIKNLDLIKEMFARYQAFNDHLDIFHVNGHVGVEGNELADRMSIKAIDTQTLEFVQDESPFDIKKILALRAG
ncbi:MAG: ribonuclease HI [Gammaproteobacteria bacterium]|jgi:ribonuclease HI